MTELRCDHKLHAELFPEEGILEVKCNSVFCGHGPGVVVLHQFDVKSGKMVDTKRYKNPERRI